MSELEFKRVLRQVQREAEIADKKMADLLVVVVCNLCVLIVAYITVEVLL